MGETEEDKNRIVTPTLETQVPPVHWCPTTMSEDSEPVREARTEARTGEETEDEDDFGYEEEFSVGIDLPQGQDTTSGNVTPIPTTGELEELSISSQDDATIVEDIRSGQGSRATPLKSLLKKPSVDIESSGDSDSDDGKISPKKVHFSEIDQVKLMSQESIASMVSSDSGDPAAAHTITMTSPIGASLPQRPGLGNVTTAGHVTTLGHVTSLLQATSLPHGTGLSSHPRTMEMAAMMADRQQELSRALGE